MMAPLPALCLRAPPLRAEREQNITIDVAYRYFATPKRKFIIADTPGHVQYTRNMVTGASTAARNIVDFRFPVQYVVRLHQDYRGFSGGWPRGPSPRVKKWPSFPEGAPPETAVRKGRRVAALRHLSSVGMNPSELACV